MSDNGTPTDGPMTLEEMEQHYASIEDAQKKEAEAAAGTGGDPEPKPEPKPQPGPDVDAFKEALRISEEGRKALQAQLESRSAAPVDDGSDLDNLTDDDLAKLIDEKGPVAAMRIIQAQTLRIGRKHYDARLAGMANAGIGVAEAEARRKYPVEFELFADEIRRTVESAPDKSALANTAVWDNMISFIRGQPGNIEKWVDARTKKSDEAARTAAQEAQRAGTGVHVPAGGGPIVTRPDPAGETYGLDRTEQQIAETLGVPFKDYARELGRI